MATKVYGATYWQQQVRRTPTWALKEELARREVVPARDSSTGSVVQLPGIVVDPVGSVVRWRGEEYALSGRRMEVLYALASARQKGCRRLRCKWIAEAIFRDWEEEGGRRNVRMKVTLLRKQFPGLIDRHRIGMEVAYGLVLDEDAA